jgi:hypothetical protein
MAREQSPKLIPVTGSPPLTDEQLKRLAELAARPDSEIDFSDIPEWADEMFERARRATQVN